MSKKISSGALNKEGPVITASIIFFIIGLFGLFYFRTTIIFELGLLTFFTDLAWETYGTQKGLWNYKHSKFYMIRKVPIEIPFLAMSVGLASGTIILFLISIF